MGLVERGRRALRRGDGVGELGPLLVAEQERRPGPLEVPLDVVGEQAEKDVGPDPRLGPVVDRADLQVDRLEAPEGALDPGQELVRADDVGAREALRRDRCTEDVEPVEGCLLDDRGLVAGDRQPIVGDRDLEVLGDLVAVDDLADREPDPGRAGPLRVRS